MTITDAFQQAVGHHQAGQLAQAETLYRQVLAVQPQHADALHLLGVLASQVGQQEAAVELIGQAIALNPSDPAFHSNIGEAYRALGRLEEAIASFQQALALNPDQPEAYNNLGLALGNKGQTNEAIACFQKALAINPDYVDAHNNLGIVLGGEGQTDEAIAHFRHALEINPNYAEAYCNLGIVFYNTGKLNNAIEYSRHALALNSDYSDALNNLGIALGSDGQSDEAVECFQKVLEIKPDFAEGYNSLGNAWKDKSQINKAIACYERSLALKPDYADGHNNLGNALSSQGQIEKAIECYRRAVALAPDEPSLHSNLIFSLHFHPDYDAAMLGTECRQWDRQHGQPRRQVPMSYHNNPDPERRLKVGYISPDLREHPVGRFLMPLFEHHNHKRFEIICYADVVRPDAVTKRLCDSTNQWRDTTGWPEKRLADQISDDGIDILIDLSLHTGGNRLLVFARKPAPVQVTWLAYAGTSGLETMDYRLTDPFLDPPAASDDCYSETSLRLPQTYWCYPIPDTVPTVTPLPAFTTGHITFGCLNNFSKVNERVLSLWTRVLHQIPDSRLLLFAHKGSHRERVWEIMSKAGISQERIAFLDNGPLAEYFRNHEKADIALDPFPYAGGTTTCDALWMGVPVVSLVGKTAVGRGGLSILSNIGLPELAANSEDEYVQIAVGLANDLPRLGQLRATMRERMQASPLMDAPRFARNMEEAYRTMWQNWCEGQKGKGREV